MGMVVWWKRLRSLLRRKFNVPTSHEQESRLGVAFISFSFLYIFFFSSCLCAPHKTINLLLQNRCALFPFAGASFSFLQTTPSHTHTHTYTNIRIRIHECISICMCIASSRFVGFVIIVGSILGAIPTRQQAFQLWLWRWLLLLL